MAFNESENNKRIAINTILLYVRMMFLMLVSLYTSRVVLDALGVTDFGIYNVVGGFVAMFGIISSVLSSASSRYLNFEMGKGNSKRLNTVFSTLFIVQVCLAIIIALLCESFGIWYVNNIMVMPADRVYAANFVFQFSVIIFCVDLITVPYNAAIIAHEDMKTFAFVSIFDGLARLAICFMIQLDVADRLISYGFLLLCVQNVVMYLYRRHCKKNYNECHYKFVIEKPLVREMLSYSGWHLFGNSASLLKYYGVDMVLNLFFGPTINAAKGIANNVMNAVSSFSANFMTALTPQITKNYANGNTDYLLKLVYNGARFSFFLLLFISLPIIFNTEYLLKIWLKQVPDHAIVFAQLSLITSMIDAWARTIVQAQDATGRVKLYQIVIGSILLLNVPACYMVLKLGAYPEAVMIVILIIDITALMARLFLIPKYIELFNPFNYLKKVVFRCCSVTAVALILPLLINECMESDNVVSFLISICSCILSSLFAILYVGCSKVERDTLRYKIRNKLYKIKNNLT